MQAIHVIVQWRTAFAQFGGHENGGDTVSEGLHGHECVVRPGSAVPHTDGLVVAATDQCAIFRPVADLRKVRADCIEGSKI